MPAKAVLSHLSDVEPSKVKWLWAGRIPLGKLTILDGDPGTSKTTIALDIAARLSRGDVMPDGTASDLDGPRGTLILTAEDDLGDTIRPRLDAAGADVGHIAALTGVIDLGISRPISVYNIDAMEHAIETINAAMIFFDPIVAYLGSTDTSRDSAVRATLTPLITMAADKGVAIVAIRHLNKKSDVSQAMYRGGGSIGFSAAARSVLLAGIDPDDDEKCVLASIKCNIAAPQASLSYRAKPHPNGTIAIEWLGISAHNASALLSSERGTRASARAWLEMRLASGGTPATDIQRESTDDGFTWATIRRAAEDLHVVTYKNGFQGPSFWKLPDSKDAQSGGVGG